MMDRAVEWMTGLGGLVTWLGLVVVIVGVGVLMRHLSLSTRAMEVRQVAVIVAASVGLLLVASVGGFALMQAAATSG